MLLNPATLLLLASSVSAKVLKFDLGAKSLEKRSLNETHKLTGLSNIFEGSFDVGTPGQEIHAIFDTGSYTLGVMWSGNEYCDKNSCTKGEYDPSKSSTSDNTTKRYPTVGFADGSTGDGHYFTDNVTIAGANLHDFKFNLIESSTSELNTFGIGPDPINEGAPILLNYMTDQSLIKRKVFSSYYSEKTDKAVLLFGGLDKERYSGQLQKLTSNDAYNYKVALNGLSTECGTLNGNGYIYQLDTGAGFGAAFPDVIYHRLNQLYGGAVVDSSVYKGPNDYDDSFYAFKCQNAKPLVLDLQGKKVTWSARSQILPLTSNGQKVLDQDGDQLCTSYMINTGNDTSLLTLGAAFLKDMFVVWDGENTEVSIAQGKQSDSEDIIEITGDVPDAVNAPDYGDFDNLRSDDNSFNQPSTTSLSYSAFTATGTYYGTFATDSCDSTTTLSSSASSATASSSADVSSSSGSSARLTTPSSSLASSSIPSSVSSSVSSSSINPTTPIEKQVDNNSSLNSSQVSSSVSDGQTTIYSSSYSSISSATCVSCAYKNLKNVTSTAIESENHTVLKTITSCSDNKCSEIITTIEPSTTESATPPSTSLSSIISTTSGSASGSASSASSEGSIPSSSNSPVETGSSTTSLPSDTPAGSESQSNVESKTTVSSTTESSSPASESSKESPKESTESKPSIEGSSSSSTANPSLAPKSSSALSSSSSSSSTSAASLTPAISTYEGSSNSLSAPFIFKLISNLL
ncbi:Lysosomal aspartic protease [Wickerhamomyces ciferrii]|uniref:Lysosomal aspartic protease n=1 Tax=Wickerhamomyces ciferrii (strain ATCC 14091 / BCRC 22168 / CBS 111 / JCM 3599 / NBRC 0793 / NRRL Y-1031 F-60-10) TaxID=1206466 RepID=K0KDY9_WICCF|nr:Lysosomal aspartic protease [Wickerhamomyces ciferrii]CCH43300.1 Lysosomal aspartic protease [Wickerhamomyces ciferrii]